MSGAIPPLPSTPSWRGAQLKKPKGQLYLYPSNPVYLTIFTTTLIRIVTSCSSAACKLLFVTSVTRNLRLSNLNCPLTRGFKKQFSESKVFVLTRNEVGGPFGMLHYEQFRNLYKSDKYTKRRFLVRKFLGKRPL